MYLMNDVKFRWDFRRNKRFTDGRGIYFFRGPAVYNARALRGIVGKIRLTYPDACAPANFQRNANAQKKIDETPAALTLYPNPARTEVRLRYQGAENVCPMEVLDPQGKLVKRFTLSNGVETVFDVSDFSPGLYLFRARVNGENLTHKVIINR